MAECPGYHSSYVSMTDRVDIAVDVWRPSGSAGQYPVVFGATRYWRAYDLGDLPIEHQRLYGAAQFFSERQIAFVMCDVRGSGASFGMRTCEYSDREVEDYGRLIQWVLDQDWCNGTVVSFGISYSGNAALLATVAGGSGLKAAIPCFIDYDLFHHSTCPGGIANRWMSRNWGAMTAALDRNDFRSATSYQPSEPDEEVLAAVKGVRPVDGDFGKVKLNSAIAMHAENYRADVCTAEFSDDAIGSAQETTDAISLHARLKEINESGTPVYCLAGWFDASTALAAISLFRSLEGPKQIIIGPWNHGMTYEVDPYQSQDVTQQNSISVAKSLATAADILDRIGDNEPVTDQLIHYYTYGKNEWQISDCWPVSGHRLIALHCGSEGSLSLDNPVSTIQSDICEFDQLATTGCFNRWHTQIGSTPVVYPDREWFDRTLLTYDTSPLSTACEITGQPSATLFVKADCSDATVFVYLEDVAPDGQTAMLTEGCLRAIHRDGRLNESEVCRLGRSHSFRRGDVSSLVPGEIACMRLDLLPISAVVRAGHRFRLSIAAYDRDTFEVLPDTPTRIELMHGSAFPSCIELPVVALDGCHTAAFS